MKFIKAAVLALLRGSTSTPVMAQEMPFDAKSILTIIAAHAGDTDQLIAELEKIFEDVHVLESVNSEILPDGIHDDRFYRVALDLWSNHQPYATLVCQSFNIESRSFLEGELTTDPDQFTKAVFSDFGRPDTRRILCILDYWDPEVATNQFIKQATIWRSARIGTGEVEYDPIAVNRTTAVDYNRQKEGPWAMTIALISGGEEAQISTALLFDLASK